MGAKEKIFKREANWDNCRENILEPVGVWTNGAMKCSDIDIEEGGDQFEALDGIELHDACRAATNFVLSINHGYE